MGGLATKRTAGPGRGGWRNRSGGLTGSGGPTGSGRRRRLGGVAAVFAAASVLATTVLSSPLAPLGPTQAVASGYPLPAPAVQPEPCPPPNPPHLPPPPPLGRPSVPENAVPIVKSPGPRHVSLAAVSGKGIWLTVWPRTHLDVQAVVAEVHAAGLDQIWLRTGGSGQGFYAGPTLKQLVPAAHAAGIYVIAWDFPTLSDPRADAQRAADALGLGVDGFSADIETAAEGTHLSARRVRYYLSLVRAAAGDRPVVATVMPPTSYWLAVYPYRAEAPFVDAFAPMVYWSCTEPGAAVRQAILALRGLRPVVPIGQDFNMGPTDGRPGLPTPREIWRFVDVAHRLGAPGVSLYDLESGGEPQLAALSAYPWETAARHQPH